MPPGPRQGKLSRIAEFVITRAVLREWHHRPGATHQGPVAARREVDCKSVACSSRMEQPRATTRMAWQQERGSAAPSAAAAHVLHVGCRVGMCGCMHMMGMGRMGCDGASRHCSMYLCAMRVTKTAHGFEPRIPL